MKLVVTFLSIIVLVMMTILVYMFTPLELLLEILAELNTVAFVIAALWVAVILWGLRKEIGQAAGVLWAAARALGRITLRIFSTDARQVPTWRDLN